MGLGVRVYGLGFKVQGLPVGGWWALQPEGARHLAWSLPGGCGIRV